MLRKKTFNLILISFLALFFLSWFFIDLNDLNAQVPPGHYVDTGDNDIYLEEDLNLRDTIVNVINFVLSFLGLVAVIVIIYGGFVWMTSGGEADRVNKAKKILKNGIIGLIIILISWGIVTWIISTFPGIFSGDPSEVCEPNEVQTQLVCDPDVNGNPCDRYRTCGPNGTWGGWVNPCVCPDDNGGTTGSPCDSEPDIPGCFPDDSYCDEGYYCSEHNCTCQPLGGLGDPCDAEPEIDTCSYDDDLCGPYLTCDEDECICVGPPVITSISPIGGFCEDNINSACLSDDDCPDSTCNDNTPNGAPGNLITILGHNFGNETGDVLFNNLSGNSPSELNSNCVDVWTNNQIIIAIPQGVSDGPITVETSAGETGSTNDGVGPDINDFIVNNINRPGLCLVDPDRGVLNDEITYQGVNLFNADAYFGSYNQYVQAIDSNLNNVTNGQAKVPNIGDGDITTFARGTVEGIMQNSNYLQFTVEPQEDPGPYISNFYPKEGASGQYVTIYGGGFGSSRGNSQVRFGANEANYNFPQVCLHSVWNNNQIIVKVPEGVDDGSYIIEVEVGNEIVDTNLLNPNQFQVDSSLNLSPSLCKMTPIRGQAETEVNFWGEYFGGVSDNVFANFYSNQLVSIDDVQTDGDADYFSAQVPSEAVSGPVNVRRNGLDGNSLNFEIGPCQSDDDCGDWVCCPSNTYKAERCAENLDSCSIDIPNSVFEWSFETDLDEMDFCHELNQGECFEHEDCCFDAVNNECVSLDNKQKFNDEEGDDFGFCKRWNCEDNDTEKPCDVDNPTTDGNYLTLSECFSNCDPIPPEPGVSCFDRSSDDCRFDLCSGSGETYLCLNEDGEHALGPPPDCGVCCCKVGAEEDKCKDIHEVLHCHPNQDPCIGYERGLCCGCSNDEECGDLESMGCGGDTCCRVRPQVDRGNMMPQDGQEDVCRNQVISIPFNQRMNVNSLNTNILLLEERESGDFCPSGTMLSKQDIEINQNFFVRLYNNIRNTFARLFSPAIASPSNDNLYCLIPGSTQVEQKADHSVARFYPRNLLKDDTTYYIVVKGDEDLDSQNGVLSAWEIGMNEDGYQGDDGVEFNLVSFSNSYISKFRTLDDQEINSGVCEIDYVEISPSSYLFNTTENDLNEDDSDSDDDTFDTARDRDKVFHANAYTNDGYMLNPVTGYKWDWKWTIGDNSILEELNTSPELSDNQLFIGVRSEITDANTYLQAEIDMSDYELTNFNTDAHGTYARSNITVFVCRNPWPAIISSDLDWEPWYDDTYNYKLYYCRDDGSSSYADDLPALIHPAVETDGISLKICSTTNLPCTQEEIESNSCGPNNLGFCIDSVLKEAYFFRQARPSGGTINDAVDTEQGGEVRIDWSGPSNLIYHTNPDLRGRYRIYYAKEGDNFNYIEVSLNNCNLFDNEYSCSYYISGLENNQPYRFRVSAVSRTNIETFFSNQVTATPTDKVPPSTPSNCGYGFTKEEQINDNGETEEVIVAIKFKCTDIDEDTEQLRLYHGVSSGNYGQYFEIDISKDEYQFELDIDIFGIWPNYFAMTALDKYGNESGYSVEIEVSELPQ